MRNVWEYMIQKHWGKFLCDIFINILRNSLTFRCFLSRKSKELLRLIELRKATINPTVKIALSIHCAAILCGTEFDPKDVVKSSGLNEKAYTKQKELFEKLLDLDKKWTLDEMCSKFDMNDALKTDASRLLTEYKKKKPLLNETDNASFLSMAIYQSFKFRKMKTNKIKVKLMEFSRLSNRTWKALEEEWTNWIEKDTPLANHGKRNDKVKNAFDTNGEQNSRIIYVKRIMITI